MSNAKDNSGVQAWSRALAYLIVDALQDGGVIGPTDSSRAVGIVEIEIVARLSLGDYPPKVA